MSSRGCECRTILRVKPFKASWRPRLYPRFPYWLRPQVPVPAAFDVASIHEQTGPLRVEAELTISGTLVSMEGYNIRCLVEEAYGLKSYQLSFASLPRPHRDDLDDVFYNVIARAPGKGVLAKEQFREMLKTLLAERFKLTIHRETKDLPVYALVLDQKGLKLKENKTAEKCEALGSPDA